MHNIIVDKPYEFVPPHTGNFWPPVLRWFLPRQLAKQHGVTRVEPRGLEHFENSLRAEHGIVLAPNHSRPSDALVVTAAAGAAKQPLYIMASWHLFMQGKWKREFLRRAGAFSVYREGMDRTAVNYAIETVENARRPLVIFPEGVISRSNERLNPLQEGITFIARNAAKKRAKSNADRKVVIHPVAIKYQFHGNIESALHPVLDDIERRFTWTPHRHLSLTDRIYKVGEALLGLKEVEFLGAAQPGSIPDRVTQLIDRILGPLEQEWLKGQREANVIARVKKLRAAILPDLIKNEITDAERDRRWKHLADIYLAQQIWCYPPEYVRSRPTPERLLETVERFEEDTTDICKIHTPITAIVQFGEALEVSPERDRAATGDPLLTTLEERLNGMLLPPTTTA